MLTWRHPRLPPSFKSRKIQKCFEKRLCGRREGGAGGKIPSGIYSVLFEKFFCVFQT